MVERSEMKIIVQAKSIKVTRALDSFIKRHVQKLAKLSKDTSVVRVYLEQTTKRSSKDKNVLVKIKLEVSGQDLWVEIAGYDFYDAIVDAVAVATRKLRQNKEKQLDSKRRSGKR